MPDDTSELLGQVLTAGAALFGIAYEFPLSANPAVTFGGVVFLGSNAGGALGIAGLSVAVLGSFAGIILGQLRPPDRSRGASLLFWTNFAVLLFGGILFYAVQPPVVIVALIGVLSAFLTTLGLVVIVRRPRISLLPAQAS